MAALIIAHPGHELRLHGWIETAQPTSFVLTKGDGPNRRSRLATTRKILRAAGAREGTVFGRCEDREFYGALLGQDHGFFLGLLDELAAALVALDVDFVVGDAEEGYNPSHDVCHYLTTAAAAIASRALGRPVAVFDVLLVGPPELCPDTAAAGAISLTLDDAAFSRKLRAAFDYDELRNEVEQAVATNGAEAFRTECLRPATSKTTMAMPPFYEEYGERQVAAGRYGEVIRYVTHVLPIKQSLWRHAGIDSDYTA